MIENRLSLIIPKQESVFPRLKLMLCPKYRSQKASSSRYPIFLNPTCYFTLSRLECEEQWKRSVQIVRFIECNQNPHSHHIQQETSVLGGWYIQSQWWNKMHPRSWYIPPQDTDLAYIVVLHHTPQIGWFPQQEKLRNQSIFGCWQDESSQETKT